MNTTIPLTVGNIIKIRTENCVRTALIVAITTKYMSAVWANDKKPGVRIHKIPHNEVRADIIDYPLAKAKKAFRKMGRTFGITKSAKRALRA